MKQYRPIRGGLLRDIGRALPCDARRPPVAPMAPFVGEPFASGRRDASQMGKRWVADRARRERFQSLDGPGMQRAAISIA